jgi:hypothetical protein
MDWKLIDMSGVGGTLWPANITFANAIKLNAIKLITNKKHIAELICHTSVIKFGCMYMYQVTNKYCALSHSLDLFHHHWFYRTCTSIGYLQDGQISIYHISNIQHVLIVLSSASRFVSNGIINIMLINMYQDILLRYLLLQI